MNLVDQQTIIADNLAHACLFIDGAAEYITPRIDAKDFYHAEYRLIFANIAACMARGDALTPLAVLAGIDNPDAFIDRIASAVTGNGYEAYTGMAVEIANKRKLIALSEEISKMATDDKASSVDVLSVVEKKLNDMTTIGGNKPDFVNLRDVAKDWLTLLGERMESGKLRGLSTGIGQLDDLTGGLQGGRLYVLAGRPGSGKSAFALNVAKSVAQQGKKVAIVSLEMNKEELIDRLAADVSNVHLSNIEDGFRKIKSAGEQKAQMKRVALVLEFLAEGNISVCDDTDFGMANIALGCQRLKRTEGVDLVIVDYLGLMAGGDDEVRELGEISRSLKNLASKLDVPVIALHQVNRKCEDRSNKRPLMSDLRGSGKIEENANVVMFTYREDYYNQNPATHNNQLEIIIDKNRSGAKGTAYLNCDLSRMQITERLTPFDQPALGAS